MSIDETIVNYSSRHSAVLSDYPTPDIDSDEAFMEIFHKSRPFSMTSKPVMYELYKSVEYISKAGLDGDFVECGVWKGGSCILAALAARGFGDIARSLWLYDTYQGMTKPTDADVDFSGAQARDYIDQYGDDGKWCYAGLEEVKQNFKTAGLSVSNPHFVVGDVLETLKEELPENISLLRLDTDWYESTLMELEILYPRLVTGGILIIDDYGCWQGARKAVDEYFSERNIFFQRTSSEVRTAVKIF